MTTKAYKTQWKQKKYNRSWQKHNRRRKINKFTKKYKWNVSVETTWPNSCGNNKKGKHAKVCPLKRFKTYWICNMCFNHTTHIILCMFDVSYLLFACHFCSWSIKLSPQNHLDCFLSFFWAFAAFFIVFLLFS